MIDALEDNAVGNPFGPYGSVKEGSGVSVTRFLNWLEGTGDIKVMQNYRKAILDKASELKGKDIFYYKDLGRPSHATALDYFLNKPATQSEVTETQEEISDTPLVTETNQVSLFDSMSDVLKVTLRDNNRYDPNDINAAMLEGMGYTMAEAGKIIKKYNC